MRTGHATTLGAASGLVAGLVAITPCAGFVGGMSPVYIGLIAGAACAFAISLKFKFRFDDSLDVVGVHLVGGIVGSLLLGFFATHSVNPAVVHQGLFVNGGSAELLGDQLVAVGATLAWSFVVTLLILFVLQRRAARRLRVSDERKRRPGSTCRNTPRPGTRSTGRDASLSKDGGARSKARSWGSSSRSSSTT